MQVSSRATGPNELEGRTLGPYQIMEMVGRGGMAVVYKARQTALQRFVAIKVLPPYFVHDPSFEDRFQQEAATVARLDHPNILTIFDYGQEGGYSYIVMPLVAGGTLRHWINHAEPLERLVTALSRILGALQYAHSRRPGVVHRDIKPSNVLMREDGWPLLGDFGIAKIIEPTLRVTNSSAVIGTPEYMAPEQCLADGLDHRADLYAMGVILFEILTRRLPYGGAKSFEVMYQQVNAPVPSVRTVDPSLTVAWDEVIQRSLAKNPADRYPSAAAMDEAVQAAWLETQTGRRSFVTGTTSSIAELHRDARAALRGGDWQRVIRLCGRILESDPTDVAANRSLTQPP